MTKTRCGLEGAAALVMAPRQARRAAILKLQLRFVLLVQLFFCANVMSLQLVSCGESLAHRCERARVLHQASSKGQEVSAYP
jgi:hypothetical protein